MAVGLVLEGGALRGMFTAGVMDIMLEAGIRFDGIIGVSAGAVFGCNYKSRQIGRVIRYNKKYCRDRRYCSLWSLLTTGDLFGAKFCYRDIPLTLDPFDCKTYEEDPAAFYTVTSDVMTGKAVYHRCDKADEECFDWMRASGSMPVLSRPVSVGGGLYLDGGITDSIPLRQFEQMGYARNVVILTQPAGYEKDSSLSMLLVRLLMRKYPAAVRAIKTWETRYNETVQYIEKQAAAGKVFLIRPEKKLPIKRLCHDPELLQQTYDIGRKQGKQVREALKKFLKQASVE